MSEGCGDITTGTTSGNAVKKQHSKVEIEAAAELLKAFAHPLRLAIVLEVQHGERCVHDLTDALGASQPLISQHLKILRQAGVLSGRRRGREIAYSIADHHVTHIALDALEHANERNQQ